MWSECVTRHTHAFLLTDRLAKAGHKVVGVDISATAVQDFFINNHLPYEEKQIGSLVQYKVHLWNPLASMHTALSAHTVHLCN